METIRSKANIITVSDADALAHTALELFSKQAQKSVSAKAAFYVAISGGHTPKQFFQLLGEESALPWQKTHLLWVDEHCVPPDSQWSNYRLAADSFLPKINIPPENVHRIYAERSDCKAAAHLYEETIRQVFGLQPGKLPQFDLIVLGMGVDAHTGSLFRDSYAVFEKHDLVCAVYFMDGKRNRITLTHPVLCAAKELVILISGEEKAAALRDVLTSERDEVKYPIHTIWPILNRVTWLVDNEAAKYL